MKHIHKYIFVTIIILLLTSTLQASPKAFDSLGNELEALQKDCKQYLQDPKVSKKLKATCKKFNAKVDKAFKMGYPLDASVESNTADENKLDRYLALLIRADESGESLGELKRSREKKERKAHIDKDVDKHKKTYDDSKRYYDLGLKFDKGQGVTKNYEKAIGFYRMACDGGNALGCNNLGRMYKEYPGTYEKFKNEKAIKFYRMACDGGNALGCNNLGVMFKRGLGTKKDYEKAARFYKMACDDDLAEGCVNLGRMFKGGKGVRRNYVKAAVIFGEACDDGFTEGCIYLGDMCRYGDGVPRNAVKAASLFSKACDDGKALGCSKLRRIRNR